MHRFLVLAFSMLAAMAVAACGPMTPPPGTDAGNPGTDAAPPAAAELGTGDHTPSSVAFTTIAGPGDQVEAPRDLAFNTRAPDELWIVNYDDDSVVIVHDASTPGRTAEYKKDWYGDPSGFPASHFMAEPSAIAFGRDATSTDPIPNGVGGLPGTFATCGESRNTYDGFAPPNDFMGISLWSSDLSIFANYPASQLGSHLDMLHNSPNCMGLAWETENVYWTFGGRARNPASPTCPGGACSFLAEAAIVRYDFNDDDGVGNDYHGDGEAYQYATGAVSYVAGVPSHLAFDPSSALLYIADSGNSRIAALDTATGTLGVSLQSMEPMAMYRVVDGATVVDVVPASSGLLTRPSGLELYGGYLYVSDNASGWIHAFDLGGKRVNYLDTGRGPGAVAGMAFGPDGKLYFVDMLTDEVVRIEP